MLCEKCGVTGKAIVYGSLMNSYVATIFNKDGTRNYLGLFDTIEEADSRIDIFFKDEHDCELKE